MSLASGAGEAIRRTILEEKIAKGEASPKEKFEYNSLKFMGKDIRFEHLLILLALLKLAKTPKGLQVIETLGKEFLKGMFSTLHSLGQASSANAIAAWANPYLIALVMDRFGFINPSYLLEYKLGLSVISGAGIVEDFLDTLHAWMPFTKPEPSPFPESISFSSPSTSNE